MLSIIDGELVAGKCRRRRLGSECTFEVGLLRVCRNCERRRRPGLLRYMDGRLVPNQLVRVNIIITRRPNRVWLKSGDLRLSFATEAHLVEVSTTVTDEKVFQYDRKSLFCPQLAR